jgi:hypothetical protein
MLIVDGLSGGRENVPGAASETCKALENAAHTHASMGKLHERPGRLAGGCQAEPLTSNLTERVVDALADFYTKTRSH